MNKRDFVLASCTTLAASSVLSEPAAAAQQTAVPQVARRLARWPDLQSSMSLATWRKYIGERFAQPVSTGGTDLVLRGVEQIPGNAAGEQFTLVFAPASDSSLLSDAAFADSTPALRHRATGQQVAVFLQPAGQDVDGLALYRADFNLLPSSA
jgi:hypothetical protein